jgi:hypothetical protein
MNDLEGPPSTKGDRIPVSNEAADPDRTSDKVSKAGDRTFPFLTLRIFDPFSFSRMGRDATSGGFLDCHCSPDMIGMGMRQDEKSYLFRFPAEIPDLPEYSLL